MAEYSELFPAAAGNRAHYPGDVREAAMSQREPFGPDMFGALYTAVGADYDSEADRTTVQFRPVPKAERAQGRPVPGELPPMTRQQRRQLQRLNTPRNQRKSRR